MREIMFFHYHSLKENTRMMENTYAPHRIMKNSCMTAARKRSGSGDHPYFLVIVNIAGKVSYLFGMGLCQCVIVFCLISSNLSEIG
ncbi:hypothetical protein EUGRSUZ_C00466 [Eucalyptus grandis]|uniref:Uncharacterized protein n=2 Tax=Eucalyptus grandis TaxID=71139 RepID=A0ACC3L9Y3_EUCGR|nr:hypothetical protein EUGRSUZ_C00466 [Eucalyptus grandis]